MNQKEQKKELKRLTKALSQKDRALVALRRENAMLRRQLSDFKGAYRDSDGGWPALSRKRQPNTPERERQDAACAGAVNARRFAKKSYIGYLVSTVKESALGGMIRRVSRYLRRLRLVRTLTAILSTLLLSLLIPTVMLTVIPVIALLTLGALLGVIFSARAANHRMEELLKGKQIRVLVLPDQITFREGTFAERSALDMARDENVAVIVVTPRLLSTRGLGGEGMFFSFRKETDNLYLVRRGYYFILRRRVLDVINPDYTVIY